MCGLFASLGPRPLDHDALSRALDALHHRGPDGRGHWASPDRRVTLGHTRLAVIDPLGGAQPLSNDDGSIVAIVNGELYGFEQIRLDLASRGHRFHSGSDSEIVVHLYDRYGTAFVDHLRGEFALVLWDARDRVLIAARDRFGVKPLVYTRQGDQLMIASEAKAIFAAGVPARWDHASLFQCASLQYPLPDRTLFEGVLQLPPGHLLRAYDGHVQITRFWDMDHPPAAALPEPSPQQESLVIERFAGALDEAVRVRLRADVPVAFQLSGGIDSSAVLALAAPHLRETHAFTVSFDDASYDEVSIARETAAHCGAVLHEIPASPSALAAVLEDAIAQGEGLAINAHIAAKYLLSRAIREAGFRVVLTGEGSDEVLAGYPHLRRDLIQSAPEDSLVTLPTRPTSPTPSISPRASAERATNVDQVSTSLAQLHASNTASAGIMMPEGGMLCVDAIRQRLGFVPSWIEAKASLGRRVHSLLAQEFSRQFAGRDAYRLFLDGVDVEHQLRGRTRVDQSLYLWNQTALASYILRTLGDGMEMAHSIEGRVPFLDHELFGLTRTLPLSLKIRGGVEKWILREALGDRLTPTVRTRQKHPFMAPPLSRVSTSDSSVLEDLLRSSSLPDCLDRARILALLESLPSLPERERQAWDPALMLITSMCVLHRRYRP